MTNPVDYARIKRVVTIAMILSRYGLLESFKRSGAQLRGACPIHRGSNKRQFVAQPIDNTWRCFGDCDRGGSILELVAELASGGMATVYLARLSSVAGFQRLYAIKRLHPHLERDTAFVSMFLVTSVAMVRERTSGTLERLLSTPIGKLDVLFGYGIAFGLLAICQAGIAAVVSYTLLGLRSQGSQSTVLLIAASTAVLGAAIGLLTSAFAQTEFQALQFMPVVVLPQVLLCGLVWPREEMSGFLQVASNFMPLRYAAEALREVETYPDPTTLMWRDLVVIVVCAILVLVGAAATLRRQTD